MSNSFEKSRKTSAIIDATSDNAIYTIQLQELARVFSSSGDRHIRQYIINLANGVLERANDYAKVEAYISEMLS